MNIKRIPLIIPAYEPDERLILLAKEIRKSEFEKVIIVNDGSGEKHNYIYSEAQRIIGEERCILLIHDINRGKGRALKTAFEYVIKKMPDIVGVVTADSDGQHSVECIQKVMEALVDNRQNLILGVRQFDDDSIPWKSRIGNTLTLKIFKLLSGLDVQDTQTGLRGIPNAFVRELINVDGERFEFEMEMLIASVNKYPIKQVPIKTIYESKSNHQTHFDPLTDSIKIYRIIFKRFLQSLLKNKEV